MPDTSPAPTIASTLGYFRTAAMLAAPRLARVTRIADARAVTPLSLPVAKAAAAALAPLMPDARRILDVAAGSGMFGIEMLRALPDAHVTALDWPAVLEVAKANAVRRKVADRVSLLPGSALAIDLGADYDLVMLPNFLHHFDEVTNVALLRRARAALGE